MHQIDSKNWVKNYADYLYSIALFKTNMQTEAEDLVQETFLAAFKSKDEFRGQSTEKTWLTAILNNKITDHYRRKKFEKPFSIYITETENEFQNHFFNNSNFGRWIDNIAPNYISNNADKNVLQTDFENADNQYIQALYNALISKVDLDKAYGKIQ